MLTDKEIEELERIDKEEFEELEKENDKIREKLGKLILHQKTIWSLIGELVENEINQERFCNQ
jgi:hypothetical protein